jgi:hypothetical protein
LHEKFKGRTIKEITEEEYISNVFLEAIWNIKLEI